MNVWVISNEDAGRSLSNDMLHALVQEAGHSVVGLVNTDDIERTPPTTGVELVVAAGGDGTVEIAVNVAARASLPLAILPRGTANNIASSLGIAGDTRRLIGSWKHARRVRLDLGHARSGSRQWLVVEGLGGGLVPAGIAAAQRTVDRPDAHPSAELDAAVWVFDQVLRKLEPVAATITIDGTRISEDLLVFEVLNIPAVGPNLVLAPNADPLDGMFDVVLAGRAHRNHLLEYLEARMRNGALRLSLPCYRARHVHIEACGELHVDDERIDVCDGGLEISIEPGAVTVLI
jgi:diacylglycerol kinase family enzyme